MKQLSKISAIILDAWRQTCSLRSCRQSRAQGQRFTQVRNPVNPDFAHHKATAVSIWGAQDSAPLHVPGAVLQGESSEQSLPLPPAQPPASPTGTAAASALCKLLAAFWNKWSFFLLPICPVPRAHPKKQKGKATHALWVTAQQCSPTGLSHRPAFCKPRGR